MIEKIQIRNVGTNEKLDIEFGPQVTTLIGKSYIGKSWALRALRKVALNKPAGTSYINWEDDKNIAKIRLAIDGKKIIRTRSKTINTYKLSGKKKPYVAFGNGVPEDIAKILNLSEINFQGQHSTKENRIPFWFCETAGEVSRQLNSIVNLELIDSTLANIASKKTKTDTIIKITKESLKKAKQQKKNLLYVIDLNEDLENIENLQKQHEQDTRQHAIIDEKIEICINTRILIENRLAQASDGLKVMAIGKLYLRISDSTEKLYELVKSGRKALNILKNKPPTFLPISKLKKEMVSIIEQYYNLNLIIKTIDIREDEKCQNITALQDLKKDLTKLTKNRCPLCGKLMKTS